ncbi:MAG: hypothetical protein AAGE52_14875 [Myxococcota bacterium]
MTFGFRTLPEGVILGELSEKVFDVLQEHTSFPWPVMQAQCKRVGIDPTSLSKEELATMVVYFADAVGRFTSPERRQSVLAELSTLL